MRRRRAVAWLLVASFVVGMPVAHADPGAAAALKQFEDGVRFYEQGQFERALLAFQGSLSLLPSPNTRLYIARCFRELGKSASAHTSYRLSAREAGDRLAQGEKRFAATRDAASSEASELAGKVPLVTLAVPATPPPELAIAIDGGAVPPGAWGSELELDPGTHRITAAAPRHEPFALELSLADGERKRVEIALERRPTAFLLVELETRPSGLSVQLDRRPLEVGTKPVDVAPGPHVLEVAAPGYRPFRWAGSLKDGEHQRVSVTLDLALVAVRPGNGTPPWLFFTALGVSAVGMGTGSAFALSAKSSSDEQKALDPLQRDAAVHKDIERKSFAANLSIGVGALGLVGAGVLYFTTGWSRREPQKARVSPFVSPASAGLAAEGRF